MKKLLFLLSASLRGVPSAITVLHSVQGRSLAAGAFYECFLSKRATFYASYRQLNIDGNFRTSLIAADLTVAPSGYGPSMSAFSLGMRYSF